MGNSLTPSQTEDSLMADGSTHDSDEEEGEDGEDGEDDDEGSVDNQASPSKPSQPIPTPSSLLDTEMGGVEGFPIPPLLQIDSKPELKLGSPLKNLALSNSTLNSPLESPKSMIPVPFPELSQPNVKPELAETTVMNDLQEAVEAVSEILPSPPPNPTIAEEVAVVEVRQAEEEEEEMLLDIIETADNSNIGAAVEPIVEVAPIAATEPIVAPESESVDSAVVEDKSERIEDSIKEERKLEEPSAEVVQTDDDDDFPDLLGGLEAQLDEPVVIKTAVPAEAPGASEEKEE